MEPETYVVRIYRRARGKRFEAVGLLEAAASRRAVRFTSLSELVSILAAPRLYLKHKETEGIAAAAIEQTSTPEMRQSPGLVSVRRSKKV